jgi:hypothetical protein
VIASPLVLAFELGTCVEVLVKTQLHDRHNWAPSGLSVPHFGQYIFCLLSSLLLQGQVCPRRGGALVNVTVSQHA